ncbi:hypothetical protein HRbin33_01081 [bacterium HR33]|nr:hypothetical protein HRbin33_01081 [bacterium HR33]
MAQVFISHSARDKDLVDFFARLGARTKVRLVFEELEAILAGTISPQKIRRDIASSNAVFLILSKNVQAIPHTRDWVVWEAGVASNKDIWIFELASDRGTVSVVTPFLRHYVVFEPNDSYFNYLSAVLESYDDSHVLGTLAATTGIGAALGEGAGALLGLVAGAIMSDRRGSRPTGVPLKCVHCSSVYSAHLPDGTTTFRCPVCNTALVLPPPAGTAA